MKKIIEDDNEITKSKTQLKHEMHELQDLGEALLALPMAVYNTMPLPEELDKALNDARTIKALSAKRRQLQFIGKIMRHIDVEPIQIAFQEWQTGNRKLAREHHHLENVRDQLIAGDAAILDSYIQHNPDCDIQQLRQLIRLAQQEKKLAKPPKNYRKLFQFLKETKEQQDNPAEKE